MENSVKSGMPRKKEGRIKVTYSVDPQTDALLDAYSEQSDAPKGRILDKAVAAYLDGKIEPKDGGQQR